MGNKGRSILKGKAKGWIRAIGYLALSLVCTGLAHAQMPRNLRLDGQGRPMGPASRQQGGDSLKQRDHNEDSITIYYRYFDSSRIYRIDSSVTEFSRFPIPAHHLYLGSLGSATRPLIFQPNLNPGFDAGFHAYDAYRLTVAQTRIYQTTRPYTELDYYLGSRAEQTIKVLHTQNLTPTWNASFDYQFMSSPGNFKNNNASHSGMRLSSGFSTKNRRYSGFFAYLTNRNSASQNGGIASDTFLQSKNTAFYTRFNIPTWLGGDGNFGTNFFATGVTTGNRYRQQQIFFRHQYDLGQKDSLINAEDSSVTRIFYPRLRLQHTLNYQTQEFSYFDNLTETDANYTAIYTQRFGFTPIDLPIGFKDKWTEVTNEAALILFPEKNNQEQFLKLGAGYQILQAQLGLQSQNFNNLYVLGEYRNRTRNRKWDINAFGRLYLSGLNAGNYTGSLSLERNLGQRLGILKVGFLNTNRTPGFVFDDRSSFPALDNSRLGTENWTRVSGNLYIPRLQLSLAGNYYLVSNYTFFKDYLRVSQAGLLSILHLSAEKKIKISRRWNWYAQLHIQQGGSNEINLPPLYTRHKLAYEAVLYKNLNLSTGVELRYFLPFSADDFNPLNQQWVVQNNQTISNRPDIHAFLHLRIRSFRLFARAENLNTLDISRGFGFLENNLAAPLYPTPGLFIRLGIYWTFVN